MSQRELAAYRESVVPSSLSVAEELGVPHPLYPDLVHTQQDVIDAYYEGVRDNVRDSMGMMFAAHERELQTVEAEDAATADGKSRSEKSAYAGSLAEQAVAAEVVSGIGIMPRFAMRPIAERRKSPRAETLLDFRRHGGRDRQGEPGEQAHRRLEVTADVDDGYVTTGHIAIKPRPLVTLQFAIIRELFEVREAEKRARVQASMAEMFATHEAEVLREISTARLAADQTSEVEKAEFEAAEDHQSAVVKVTEPRWYEPRSLQEYLADRNRHNRRSVHRRTLRNRLPDEDFAPEFDLADRQAA